MKSSALIAAFFLLFTCFYLPDYADARIGGGRSIGGRPQMNTPARMPSRPQATSPATPAATNQGALGGMGGMLGGFLAGSLLGSLFSGNGMGGGAGGGIGFMDILLIAILAFIGWRLFTRFRNQRAAQQQSASPYSQPMQRDDTGPVWNNFRDSIPGAAPQPANPGVDIPAGFNQEEFLRGARMAYARMQKAWDNRDLADIAQFASPVMMREFQAQAAQDPGPSRTELLRVNAELVGVEPEGDNLRAQVLFDVLMREDPNQAAPEDVREIWHFLRIGQNGNWKLDGIQQVQ